MIQLAYQLNIITYTVKTVAAQCDIHENILVAKCHCAAIVLTT